MNKISDKEEEEKRRKQIARSLGKNILKLRREKNYTREELAEKSNLSPNYIYSLESGVYLPGCLALIDLSNALDTTPSQLLDNYIENKKNNFLENITKNIDNLSDRDLYLLLTITEYLSKS